MGRVTTEVSISNLRDLYEADQGRLGADQVRRIVVKDALVDTGASTLALIGNPAHGGEHIIEMY